MRLFESASECIERGMNIRFNEETCQYINDTSVIRTIPKATIVLRQGEISKSLCYIVRGIMRGFYIDRDGNDITKCFTAENDFVCTEGLRTGDCASFSVESIEECICIFIPYETLLKSMQKDSNVKQLYDVYSIKALCYFEKRERELLTKESKERYLNFMREYGTIEKRVSQAHIAAYIGVRPSSLSRLRRSILSK